LWHPRRRFQAGKGREKWGFVSGRLNFFNGRCFKMLKKIGFELSVQIYERSVTSPLIRNGAINDVMEGIVRDVSGNWPMLFWGTVVRCMGVCLRRILNSLDGS
jgi:hypothetical protein